MAFNVVAFGEQDPPTVPSLHVPPVADPPVLPPKAAEVLPLQILVNALPALAVAGAQPLILTPVIEGIEGFDKVVEQVELTVELGIVRFPTDEV